MSRFVRGMAAFYWWAAHELVDELHHWRLVRLPDHPRSTR